MIDENIFPQPCITAFAQLCTNVIALYFEIALALFRPQHFSIDRNRALKAQSAILYSCCVCVSAAGGGNLIEAWLFDCAVLTKEVWE